MADTDATVAEFVARQLWHAADDFGGPEDWREDAEAIVDHLTGYVRERIAADIKARCLAEKHNSDLVAVCDACEGSIRIARGGA